MNHSEKAKRLRELWEQIADAVGESRELAGDKVTSDEWSWIEGIHDQISGYASPSMQRTVARLERAEREAV